MRANLPVTQREFDYPHDATLMSATDTQSRITYANAAFVQVSGFDADELLHQPHNAVRHPDMPREAFADMWATLKAGKSWTALVKNRRRNGDHYWVRANATPVVRSGQLAGYMSVRTRPARDEVAAAESLYRDFREGRAGSRRFHQGLIVRTGWLGWMSMLQTMSTAARLRCAVFGLAALVVVGAWFVGIGGTLLGELAVWATFCAVLAQQWLRHQITLPITRVLRQAQAVAAGQPAENDTLDRVDDIGMLLRSVNQAGLNLRSLVDDVSEQIAGVRSASDVIAQGNRDLSARTAQSTDNLQQTTAAVEQMAASIQHNADAARQASSLADGASAAAAKGGTVIGEVVNTMGQIADASRRIGDIIGVIDSIAFQTNILALNAAVEAARAGAQGRGFAVVASEVRSLAGRSAEAAKEIKQLIGASMEKVEAGGTQVQRGGEAMADIVAQVERVARLINEISSATAEQASGIRDVNQAMVQLDGTTQQNAALAEQSQATADGLQQQTARLAQAVAVFKQQLAPAGRAAAAPPAIAPEAKPGAAGLLPAGC
ncbi:methyl-accepting chemotaxis protein [Ramlibacter sp. H39-3-26]|uniref:methyl-accepting chemotaxis protein n=1 Tax=Curvibacter soli TaxID=3031331 RepID=UPI0023DB5B7C|nr:PAS domain-containing methyl-accepting chemotaxis protein [Ramlibacter sp. H39-3-26]MDF1485959.1 methyl-accepting chemotaxis protein [Ramlibacter sp. H39-3-26]